MPRIEFFLLIIISLLPFGSDARPGMGGSYNSSSSSSSSSSRSYSSSSSRSYSSTSSSSSSSSYSSGVSTPSIPQSTAYFDSKDHFIKFKMNGDGSVDVEESFIVAPNTSKVGVDRKKYPIHSSWSLSDIKNETGYTVVHDNESISVLWTEEKNKVEIPIYLNYKIKSGITWIGNYPLFQWKIPKTSIQSPGFNLEFEWDESIVWKDQTVSFLVYDTIKNDIIAIPVKNLNRERNKFYLNTNLENSKEFSLEVKGSPKSSLLSPPPKPEKSNQSYSVKQNVYVFDSGKNKYDVDIQLNGYKASDSLPGMNFGLYWFHHNDESWNDFVTPGFQIIYELSGLNTYFWHLYNANFENVISNPLTGTQNVQFSFSVFGEQYMDSQKIKKTLVRIPLLDGNQINHFSNIETNLIFPDTVNPAKTKISFLLGKCSYCTIRDNSDSILIPIAQNWDNRTFKFKWEGNFETEFVPYLLIEEKDKNLLYNPFQISYAVIAAFLYAPGSGSHTGYLALIFVTLTTLIGFVYFAWNKNKQRIKLEKKFKTNLQKITKVDSNFDWEDFLEKVKFISTSVVDAWVSGNMESARHYISSGVFQRFNIQLKLLEKIDKSKNLMKDFSVDKVELLEVETDKNYLTLHIKLKCSARDLTVPIDLSETDVQKQMDFVSVGSYEEVHSFTRKISANTKKHIDLMHNSCPSCGATSPFSHASTRCQYCGSVFNSGEFDWVLTEITQMIEWTTHQNKNKSNDQNQIFAKQILEDRASAVFWKWIYFSALGETNVLKRECTPPFYIALAKVKPTPLFIPVVGSCLLTELNTETKEPKARFEIRWSASRGKDLLAEHRRNKISILLPNKRNASLGFGEDSCSNCGAPFPEVDSMNCSHCKTEIPDYVSDWLLDSVTQSN